MRLLAALLGALLLLAPAQAEPTGDGPASRQRVGAGKPTDPRRTGERLRRTGSAPAQRDPAARQERAARLPGMGDQFLRQGNYRAAVAAFTKELEGDPDSVAAHVGLGRALARVGRCADALDHLWPHLDTRPFGVEASLAAAVCSRRLGLLDDALWFDERGLADDPDHVRLLTQYALDLDEAGRDGERDAVLERLFLARPDRDASAYARAVIALRRGDLDAFDEALWFWTGDDNARTERLRLEMMSWLDADHPREVMEISSEIKVMRRGLQVKELRAEASRRLGEPDAARAILESQRARRTQGSDIDAVRARVAADLGELDAARELLAEYEGTDDPDLIATFWYVAWRAGDAAAMARHAGAYARSDASPIRRLDWLVPVGERAGS